MDQPSRSPRALVFGSINVDEFFHVKDIVKPGQTISSTQYSRRAGGKGANQACAIAKAGGSVELFGTIGQDGTWVKEVLREFGVGVERVSVNDKEPTGRAIIQLSDKGENSIVLHEGANYSPVSIPDQDLGQFTHLLLQNEVPLHTSTELLRVFKAKDKHISPHEHSPSITLSGTTFFNPSPVPSPDQLRSFPWSDLDWLIVNEGELDALLNAFDIPDPQTQSQSVQRREDDGGNSAISSAREQIRTLKAHPKIARSLNVICTLGSLGVVASAPSSGSGSESTSTVYVPAAKLSEVGVVDTTGAGDCWTGYFVAELLKCRDKLAVKALRSLLWRCNVAAAMCVEKRGAMESQPTASEVDTRFASLTSP